MTLLAGWEYATNSRIQAPVELTMISDRISGRFMRIIRSCLMVTVTICVVAITLPLVDSRFSCRGRTIRAISARDSVALKAIFDQCKGANSVKLGTDIYWKYPVHAICRLRDYEMLKVVLFNRCDPNIRDYAGMSPIIHVVRGFDDSTTGGIECCEILADYGANINQVDRSGYTPLIHAVWVQDIVVIEWMLEHGAEVNQKSPGGTTALHEACQRRCDEDIDRKIINALLAFSADVNARDVNGRSPADLYKEYNRRSFSEDFPPLK